jgi:hypothetical protein
MPQIKRKETDKEKDPGAKQFTKRRSVDEGLALADAAHAMVWRLYCDVFAFWRGCRGKTCRRHRRCRGAPAPCLMRGLPAVAPAQREAAAKQVIAGGPRRIAAATHMEWLLRREPLPFVAAWRGVARPDAARPDEARAPALSL